MSKQTFMTLLILSGGIISTKMLSLFIYGHIETKLRGLHNSLWSFVFCGYSVVRTYLRGFQVVRIFFQLERIARVFNSGELCLILVSMDFVRTIRILKQYYAPSKISVTIHVPFFISKYILHG